MFISVPAFYDALKHNLFGITRTQDIDNRTADAYWQEDAWQQEDES